MGTVIHAYDLRLQRHVAVKLPRANLGEGLSDEATITAQLDHPNIVPVHELLRGDDDTRAGFSMKLVQGESLSQRLTALGLRRLEEPHFSFLIRALLQVCEAVSFAHNRGVLHLDLKPSNIMIGTQREVYVMDWGIAAKCSRGPDGWLRPTGPVRGRRGTPSNMAPEQLTPTESELDQRTDVYALGGVLYELLTGHPPFGGHHVPHDGSRDSTTSVRRPTTAVGVAGPPPGLVGIAMRALALAAEDRYQSVDEFRDDIQRLGLGGGWFPVRRFAAGEVIMREGDPGDDAYILAEGQCDVVKDLAGTAHRLRTLGPGEMFGEMALLTHGIRTATVTAATDVVAWVVTRQVFERELSDQGWHGALLKALGRRFLEADSERARLLSPGVAGKDRGEPA
jgi:serine/threonine-protein kinase